MFSAKQKLIYLNKEKKYTKKGKEQSYYIGKLVQIDWNLTSKYYFGGTNAITDFPEKIQRWIEDQKGIFVVTDAFQWALSSTVELDHRFSVSVFRAIDLESGRYLMTYTD